MDASNEGKRKKDRRDEDDDRRREKKSKRARSRSRSPAERRDKDSQRKRRRSRSRSPNNDIKQENRKEVAKEPEVKSEPPARRAKETDMLNTRTGGAYIPPARLRMMQAQITDKSSVAYQRLAWEALKKSIHGHINKINIGNIGIIIKELLKENIVRGRGLLCRSVIQAQAASPTFTNVYAALVAAVNSRFPNIGELLLKRLVIQFKRGFKRNDKPICISSASFIAHLVNQRVAHEILALELLTLLVETPTDDSVEVSISFLKECGQKLTEVSSKGVNAIFEMLRNILHEGQLDKRVQYMIEVMFQVWKDGFKDHPALIEELELVPEEEQFTHLLMLDDGTDPQDILNVFKFDDKYEENEQKYKTLSKEILGSDAESGEEDGSGESGSEESDDDEGQEDGEQKNVTIIDNTETNLVALRRTIYLTINSSLDFEECAHKLMKMELKPGQEVELCHMFLDCCAEQRTYEKFYGLLAQRFCNINNIYIAPFEEIFKDSYSTAHRLDTNRLRNVSKFFAHLLFTDSISWEVLECVKLNEEDTTSSSRIYIKILFQELAEYMGLKKLNDRLKDPTLQTAFSGVFPRDNPKNTRFSINFFTSIGLGGLTDELREHLKQMPKNVPPAEITVGSDSSSNSSSSSSSSSSDSSSDSSSSDDSESEKEKKKKKKSKKDSKKNKSPKTPEAEPEKEKNERWGHDGFYDTYGKDAQRYEARGQRDKDNFAIPSVPRRRGDDRRRDDEEDPRNRRRDDDRRDRDRRERNENGRDDDHRRNRDNNRPDRPDRDDKRDIEERQDHRDDRRDRDREGRPDHRDDRRDRDEKQDNRDDRRDRDREERQGQRVDKRDRERDEKQDNKDDRRDKDREERQGQRVDKRDRERDEKQDNKDDRRDKDREERQSHRVDKREKDRDEKHDYRDDRRDRDRDNYRRDRNESERDSGYESRHKRLDDEKRDREKSRKDDRKEKDDDKSTKERSGRDERQDDNEKERKKEKRSRTEKERRKDSDSDSSDEETRSRKRDKDKREEKEDSRSKRKDKNKENDDGWEIRGKSVRREEGWDIRGNSIRKEDVGGRFWDMYENKKRETVERSPERNKKRETVERSPERSEKSKERRRDR